SPIVKSAHMTTHRRVRLVYANRDRDSVIFHDDLAALTARYGDRLRVTHHLDVERGFVGPEVVAALLDGATAADADFYICGPGPFMDVVERTLLDEGVAAGRVHIERFTPAELQPPEPIAAEPATTQVTIEVGGKIATADHRPGTTILQVARQLALPAPFSCEAG